MDSREDDEDPRIRSTPSGRLQFKDEVVVRQPGSRGGVPARRTSVVVPTTKSEGEVPETASGLGRPLHSGGQD